MSGIKAFNIPAFDAAAASLRLRGFEVVSPAEQDGATAREVLLRSEHGSHDDLLVKEPWSLYLARDFRILADEGIDAIVTLPGWKDSKGARLEVLLGKELGIEQIEIDALKMLQDDFGVMTFAHHEGEKPSPTRSRTASARSLSSRSSPADLYDGDRFVLFEENPLRQRSVTGGAKDNRGKSRVDLLPSKPLIAIGDVLEYGARKYKPHNWRLGLAWSDTMASLQRHLLAFNDGENLDPETGRPHLAHAGCQLLFLLEYYLTCTGTDDRWASYDHEEAKA
jgi:hypothetical protein